MISDKNESSPSRVGMQNDSNELLLSELLDDKQTFIYKKLVVPVNMRSIYWKCYGFPANDEGEILTKVKIVCILCKIVISYNGNTSNLRMHLKSKHPEVSLSHVLLSLDYIFCSYCCCSLELLFLVLIL